MLLLDHCCDVAVVPAREDHEFEILIDGKLWVEQLNRNARVFYNVSLYASDPWYPAQDGEIRNLEYPEGLYYKFGS